MSDKNLWETVNDPKKQRTETVQVEKEAFKTVEEANNRIERARKHEKWARGRAAFWLDSVRMMHANMAKLKRENAKLKQKLRRAESHSQ